MSTAFSYILSYGGMATVGLLAAAGCAVALGVHEKLDWPVLFPIYSLSLLPLYLGAKLFGVISYGSYRLSMDLPLSLPELVADSGKARRILGWTPSRSLEDSVRSAFEWEKTKRSLR